MCSSVAETPAPLREKLRFCFFLGVHCQLLLPTATVTPPGGGLIV
jgi:hypothetical protein